MPNDRTETARQAALLQWFAHELRRHQARDRQVSFLVRDLERLAATLLVRRPQELAT